MLKGGTIEEGATRKSYLSKNKLVLFIICPLAMLALLICSSVNLKPFSIFSLRSSLRIFLCFSYNSLLSVASRCARNT